MKTTQKSWTKSMLFLAFAAPGFAGEPSDQIKQTTDKILAVVETPDLKGAEHVAERQKQMRLVVDERFDWGAMARSATGKYWGGWNDEQRKEFTSRFSELIEKNYMSQVEGYSGEKIVYKGDKADGAYGVVDVVIVTLKGTDIPVSYRVVKKGAEWQVYDVIIEGVSLVNNYRSQIGAILNSSTYDALIAKIQAKIDAEPVGAAVKRKPADGKNGAGSL